MTNLSFKEFDKFNRQPFADNITKAITRFFPLYEGAYVLSLNAPYGSGKTTFLKMWEDSLIKQQYDVVYINAWETDYDEEPIVPIVSKLLEHLSKKKEVKQTRAAMKEALVASTIIGNQILAHVTGADMYKASDEAKKELDVQKAGDELYKAFAFKMKAYEHLREQLTVYASSLTRKPLIILVDELDRVRPNYAVKFLEAIKHVFAVSGICFVLAVDRKQLEKSVKQLYGDVDFESYYLRFVTREANLPINMSIKRNDYTALLWNKYIEEPQERGAAFGLAKKDKESILATLVSTINAFGLLPRQIEKLFNSFSHLMAVVETESFVSEVWVDGTMILLAISIDNPTNYHKIGEGELLSTDLLQYLSKLHSVEPDDAALNWLKTVAIAFNTSDNEQSKAYSLQAFANLKSINLSNVDEIGRRQLFQELARICERGGRFGDKSPFRYIYSLIEGWRSFIE